MREIHTPCSKNVHRVQVSVWMPNERRPPQVIRATQAAYWTINECPEVFRIGHFSQRSTAVVAHEMIERRRSSRRAITCLDCSLLRRPAQDATTPGDMQRGELGQHIPRIECAKALKPIVQLPSRALARLGKLSHSCTSLGDRNRNQYNLCNGVRSQRGEAIDHDLLGVAFRLLRCESCDLEGHVAELGQRDAQILNLSARRDDVTKRWRPYEWGEGPPELQWLALVAAPAAAVACRATTPRWYRTHAPAAGWVTTRYRCGRKPQPGEQGVL